MYDSATYNKSPSYKTCIMYDNTSLQQKPFIENVYDVCGGARGVMVIGVGNGHGDTSSNPGRDWLHFT